MTTNVVSGLAQKNRAFLNRAKPQRIGRERVAGLNFDKVNDFIQLPNSFLTLAQNNIQPNLDFSFSAFINIGSGFSSANGQGAIWYVLNNSGFNGTTKGFTVSSVGANFIQFIMVNAGSTNFIAGQFNNALSLGLHHFVFVHRGNSMEVYVDSVFRSSRTDQAVTTIDYSIGISPRIGSYESSAFFYGGDIFDLKVFNKALTLYEIRDLFFKLGDVPQNFARGSMITDYRLNNFQRLASGVVIDSTQNGNNGTLVNYTAGDLTAGSGCKIIDRFGNPIRT